MTMKTPPTNTVEISNKTYKDCKNFYKSSAWKKTRQEVIEKSNYRCGCCNLNLKLFPSNHLNVDHMLPLRYHWDRRHDINHLQVLCGDCNRIKGSQYGQNWRYLVLKGLTDEYKSRKIHPEKIQIDKDIDTIQKGFSNEWYPEYMGRKKNNTLFYYKSKPVTYTVFCHYKALEYYWHYVINY